jgi:UPF0755 protein
VSDAPLARYYIVGAVVVVFGVLVAMVLAAGTAGRVFDDEIVRPLAPSQGTETVQYTLTEGKSAGQIGSDLQELGIVRSGRQFQLLVSLMGVHRQLQADTYVFQKGTPSGTVIQRMIAREVVPVRRVTFPEGIRIEEMAEIAEEAGFGTAAQFIEAARTVELPPGLRGIIPEGRDRQGFLFPDTYIVPTAFTPADLVELMLKTMDERFSVELRQAAAAQGLAPFEAITLAAIVEREAVLDDERPIIASVFLNRHRIGMKLDADPTVQFAVATDPASVRSYGYWKRDLTLEDLQHPSPYNTYLHAGMPPGPITNPGLAAIQAVARPAATTFFYFVADGIKADGSHVFAQTLEEHLANVARYQP